MKVRQSADVEEPEEPLSKNGHPDLKKVKGPAIVATRQIDVNEQENLKFSGDNDHIAIGSPSNSSADSTTNSSADSTTDLQQKLKLATLLFTPHIVGVLIMFIPIYEPSLYLQVDQIPWLIQHLIAAFCPYLTAVATINLLGEGTNVQLTYTESFKTYGFLFIVHYVLTLVPYFVGDNPFVFLPWIVGIPFTQQSVILLSSKFYKRMKARDNLVDQCNKKDFFNIFKIAALLIGFIGTVLALIMLLAAFILLTRQYDLNGIQKTFFGLLLALTSVCIRVSVPYFIFDFLKMPFGEKARPISYFFTTYVTTTWITQAFPYFITDPLLITVYIIADMSVTFITVTWMLQSFRNFMFSGIPRNPTSILGVFQKLRDKLRRRSVVNPCIEDVIETPAELLEQSKTEYCYYVWAQINSTITFIGFFTAGSMGINKEFYPFPQDFDRWLASILLALSLFVTQSIIIYTVLTVTNRGHPESEQFHFIKHSRKLLSKSHNIFLWISVVTIYCIGNTLFVKQGKSIYILYPDDLKTPYANDLIHHKD